MYINEIQFQHGMSTPEFLSHFGIGVQCAKAVQASRWPGGFRCPAATSRFTVWLVMAPAGSFSAKPVDTRLPLPLAA